MDYLKEIRKVPLEHWQFKAMKDWFRVEFPHAPMSSFGNISTTVYATLYPNEIAVMIGLGMSGEPMSVTILEFESGSYQVIINMPSWNFRSFAEVIYFFNTISHKYFIRTTDLDPPNKKRKGDVSITNI